jgi:hypothetical protein
MIQNKTNSNKKNRHQIWQMKKIGEWIEKKSNFINYIKLKKQQSREHWSIPKNK